MAIGQKGVRFSLLVPLLPGVKTGQVATPGQDSLIASYQPVSGLGRGNDNSVGGVGVKVGQGVGTDCYFSIDGDLGEPLPEQFPTPQPDVLRKIQSVFALEHCCFPERHGRYGELLAT